jgi:diguanylate cyclase (GGDEF)-like protein
MDMRTSSQQRKLYPSISGILFASLLASQVAMIALGKSEWARVVFLDESMVVVNLLASLALFYAAWLAKRQSHRLFIAWSILGLAQLAFTLGDLAWMILEIFLQQEPFPSLADGFYVAYYPLFLIGILLLPAYRLNRIEWAKTTLDLGIVLLAATLSFWNFFLGPLVATASGEPLLTQVLSLAYPAGDLLLLWAVLVLIYRKPQGLDPLPLLLLAGSAGIQVVVDYTYAYQSLLETNTSGGLLDAGWTVSYILAGLAGVFQASSLQGAHDSAVPSRLRRLIPDQLPAWLSYISYAWLAAAYLLLIYSFSHELPMIFPLIAVGVGAIISLVMIRQVITLTENERLSKKLHHALNQLQQQQVVLEKTNRDLELEIEERKKAEDQLVHDALHDALTGLPNRVLLSDRLSHALEYARRRPGYQFSVLFLDFDNFKVVNDSLGHNSGDRLLIAIGERLRTMIRASDTVARLGGDEFILLLEDVDCEKVLETAKRLQEELSSPFRLDFHDVYLTASIGITHNQPAYENAEEMLRDADIAMYKAKTMGKARIEQFHPSMRERAMTRLEMENDLRQALERGEFHLLYQPIVSLTSNQISGMEALIRWRHPQRGIVLPAEFIPVAEETGLLIPIGRWVLQEACRQMREWQQKFPRKPPMTVSVNISPSQLYQPDFVAQVEQVLRETGLDGSCLRLEITESVYLNSYEMAAGLFTRLSELGVQFQIDDFGTGYSSLSYLEFFPIQTIKIDRAFTNRIAANYPQDIVRTIIGLAHELGMDAIAEGVETEEQLKGLQRYGCNYVQGYLFSRPLDRETVEKLIGTPENSKATILHSPSPAAAD